MRKTPQKNGRVQSQQKSISSCSRKERAWETLVSLDLSQIKKLPSACLPKALPPQLFFKGLSGSQGRPCSLKNSDTFTSKEIIKKGLEPGLLVPYPWKRGNKSSNVKSNVNLLRNVGPSLARPGSFTCTVSCCPGTCCFVPPQVAHHPKSLIAQCWQHFTCTMHL